ncbi:MAG: legume-like lectin family-domain-containing protein, partial [Olpidium bornovanus]
MRVASPAAGWTGSFTAGVYLLAFAGASGVDAKGLGLSAPATAADTQQRPHRRHDYRLTFKQPYYFNNSIPFFETFGNAIPSEEYIRLAASVPGLKGSIWAKDPNKHPEWEVEFSFRASGRGTAGGEGLAFWYTKDRGQEGPIFGSKDKWDGVGIFFDTYDEKAKRNSPLVYSVINDGNKELAKSSNADQLKLGSCWRDYRNPVGPVWVRVSYYGKRLAVDIDTVKKGKAYIPCFE